MKAQIVPKYKKEVIDELPNEVICQRLRELFRYHVGRKNAADVFDVWEAVYGSKKVNKLQFAYLMGKIHRSINYLKRRTNYFIVGEKVEEGYIWYVLKNKKELRGYEKQVDGRIRGLEHMKNRAQRHIDSKAWRRLK